MATAGITFAGIFGVVVGLGMIGMWAMLLITRQVPELQTEPFRIAAHLLGEFATALALIVGGVALMSGAAWGAHLYLVAMGMLFYTVLVSPGYYAQKREWPFVGMFALILVVGLVSVGQVFPVL